MQSKPFDFPQFANFARFYLSSLSRQRDGNGSALSKGQSHPCPFDRTKPCVSCQQNRGLCPIDKRERWLCPVNWQGNPQGPEYLFTCGQPYSCHLSVPSTGRASFYPAVGFTHLFVPLTGHEHSLLLQKGTFTTFTP